ncbi:MAG TPA: beta-ketoacyl synthase N-terminal-like domain-containing protein [Anaerolineales bacterium]
MGAGMSRFGVFPEKSSRDLFVEAFLEMKETVDLGLDPKKIKALYIGNFNSERFENQGQIAPILADWIGLTPRPATRVEDACASGGVALRQGIMAIASGFYDMVLVGGVEKMSGLPIARVTDALEMAADALYETPSGFTFPGFYAAMATAYMAEYGMAPEMLWDIAIKDHENGALNSKAQLQMTIPQAMEKARSQAASKGWPEPGWRDEYDFLRDPRTNPMIAYPLRLFDCSPVTDGAAVALLTSEELARSFSHQPLYIIGSGQASEGGLYSRDSLLSLQAAKAAAQEAYGQAGIQPLDVKMAEVHDCFTIAEVIASEDLGFFEPGTGAKAAQDGMTARNGRHPLNTSGGLKSKGHPVGATGIGQVVEVWKQMRCEAGSRQLSQDVNLALTHNVGGTGQTCAVHIFERR